MPDFQSISKQIRKYSEEGKRVFTSSSFQTHSIPLLHMISRVDPTIPVVFLQTGFHFPETIAFRDKIIDQFGLTLHEVRSSTPPLQQLDDKGRFFYTSDPDHCCYLNKIAPMEPLLQTFDVWINGVRGDQNSNRAGFRIEQETHAKALRYHPVIDWNMKMIYEYINEHNLPRHPLDDKGYLSIGCEPCTRKFSFNEDGSDRHSRWFGMGKTECGLHTELIRKG